MTREQQRLIASVQAQLLAHAESIAGSSEILLNDARREEAIYPDLAKLQEAAQKLTRVIRERFGLKFFQASKHDYNDTLQEARHDIRGAIGGVLNRCQLLILDGDPGPVITDDLDRIRDQARACVDVLNECRDKTLPESCEGPDVLECRRTVSPTVARTLVSEGVNGDQSDEVDPAHILVADDDPSSRELLKRFLTQFGHRVTFARDGQEALRMVDKHDFDLILLDIMMPKLNGFQVLQALREKGILRHLPVIIISGLDSNVNAIRGIEMGAEDFLPRPVDMTLLRARVNACLEKQQLRERDFARHFPPALARKIFRHPEILTQGQKTDVTVLFCDIIEFSTIAEALGPTNTIKWLSDVMGALSECVMSHSGVLVDYAGDEIMAMWGAPDKQPNHANLACSAAMDMLAQLPILTERWRHLLKACDKPEARCETGVTIGINSGEAFIGNVGTERKLKYGALGNNVNLASRVQGATKYVRSRVLITEATRKQIKPSFRCRRLCRVRVKNIKEPVALYELGTSNQKNWAALKRSYEKALELYEQGKLEQASAVLGSLLAHHPKDGPSMLLMSRVVDTLLNKQEKSDPVWTLPGK